jgi:hypothetical protein
MDRSTEVETCNVAVCFNVQRSNVPTCNDLFVVTSNEQRIREETQLYIGIYIYESFGY